MFGFELDENGSEIFNYGKYVVFWTKEHHSEYHKCSEETRNKISISNKISHSTKEYSEKASLISKELWLNEDYRNRTVNSIRKSRTEEFLSTIGSKISEGYTDEVRQRLSKLHTGKHLSDETKEKISNNSARYWKGKHLSDETKKKLSVSLTGKHHSEDTKKKISEHSAKPLLGKHLSDKTKEKLRQCNLGKRHSDESKKKMSESQKRRFEDNPISDETKQKIGNANKGHVHSDESKKKMSDSLRKKIESGWNPNKGRKHTAETIEKYRQARIGKKASESTKSAMKNRMSVLKEMFILYRTVHSEITWNKFQTLNKGRNIEQIIAATKDALNEQR